MNNKILDLIRERGLVVLKKDRIFDYVFASIFFLSIILLGHYGIFSGYSFFFDEDNILNYTYQQHNSESNGWRPDLGLE